jgi:hypothetical protein
MSKDVINIKDFSKVHELHFRCPQVLQINQKNADTIKYEINNGVGKAWVTAKTILEAKRKLHAVLSVTEWLDG